MRKLLSILIMVLISTGFLAIRQANALLVSVSGGNSSQGVAPQIISAPATTLDDVAINLGMQGFNERQSVLLTSDLAVDGGTVSSGTTVSSHMLFLDEGEDLIPPTYIEHLNVTWTFENAIIGVMSDWSGVLEAASSAILGAPGTIYPGAFDGRGLETAAYHGQPDSYTINGNQITVSMWVIEPGDWIRVVTTPEPSSLLLLGSGLIGLGFMARRVRA